MTLELEALATAATEAAGLDDFGGDEWREGLEQLLRSLIDEAELNEVGAFVAEAQIVSMLTNRLRIIDWHITHPEVAKTPVASPIVILGQPRTGTTILFDLLAQDPALRAPLTWEVASPIPPPQTATYATDPRIAESESLAGLTESVVPGFQAVHPTGPRRGQECVSITAADFRSLLWPTVFHTPSYLRWLIHEADLASTYRYHRHFLQVLQSQHPGERWVLKTPGHQWHLSEMFTAYPDATIIHTHRDPLKVVASISSLMGHLQKLGTDETSIPQLAHEWFDHLVVGNDRSVAARKDGTVAPGHAIDVAFGDLMADTFGVVAKIYQQIGREFTAEAEAAMRQFLAENGREKHGKHTYTFADTKLDLAAARESTANYEQYFNVPREVLTADD